MINKGLLTSNSEEWETPQELFDSLNEQYKFTLDVCATKENKKVKQFFSKKDDALKQKWTGVCWMNPPYGRQIKAFMKKALESVETGKAQTVVCLVPARTDTAWWHEYAMQGEITFIRGRLKFGDSKNSAPFPSAIVVFKNNQTESSTL